MEAPLLGPVMIAKDMELLLGVGGIAMPVGVMVGPAPTTMSAAVASVTNGFLVGEEAAPRGLLA